MRMAAHFVPGTAEDATVGTMVAQGPGAEIAWARQIIGEEQAGVIQDADSRYRIIGAAHANRFSHGGRDCSRANFDPRSPFVWNRSDLISAFASGRGAGGAPTRNCMRVRKKRRLPKNARASAREIHDGLAQNLSYLVLKIGAAQKLATQGKDKELLKELRDVSDQLRHDARDVRESFMRFVRWNIETLGFLPP